MIDADSPTGYRCDNCGAFCGVVYEHRGPSITEVESCINCGTNVPSCAFEDETVSGCLNDATHEGAHEPNLMDKYWCDEHAPDSAHPLPYVNSSTDSDDAGGVH